MLDEVVFTSERACCGLIAMTCSVVVLFEMLSRRIQCTAVGAVRSTSRKNDGSTMRRALPFRRAQV
jgi:hypothetical protein